MNVLIVFLGAGLGGALRHLVNGACLRWCGPDFPYGIMLINSLGSFLMGLLAGYLAFQASEGWSQTVRLFLATGVLGGFTTFSTFSLDAGFRYNFKIHDVGATFRAQVFNITNEYDWKTDPASGSFAPTPPRRFNLRLAADF